MVWTSLAGWTNKEVTNLLHIAKSGRVDSNEQSDIAKSGRVDLNEQSEENVSTML